MFSFGVRLVPGADLGRPSSARIAADRSSSIQLGAAQHILARVGPEQICYKTMYFGEMRASSVLGVSLAWLSLAQTGGLGSVRSSSATTLILHGCRSKLAHPSSAPKCFNRKLAYVCSHLSMLFHPSGPSEPSEPLCRSRLGLREKTEKTLKTRELYKNRKTRKLKKA